MTVPSSSYRMWTGEEFFEQPDTIVRRFVLAEINYIKAKPCIHNIEIPRMHDKSSNRAKCRKVTQSSF